MPHTDSLSISPTLDLSHTLKRWQHTHALLIPLLSEYLNSTACLERAILYPTNHSDRSGVAQALSDVDKSLSSLDIGTLQLQNAQTTLRYLRNQSTVLSPVNRLPAEVLAHIFILATTCTLDVSIPCNDVSQLAVGNMSSVCSYWRRVALGASALWCHVDLDVRRWPDMPRIFYATKSLERSGALPLHIHIKGQWGTKPDAERLIGILSPYAKRVVSLHLELNTSIVHKIISSLFGGLQESPVREFRIHDDSLAAIIIPTTERYLFKTALGLSGFLKSLTKLHLDGPLLEPSSCGLSGLTELFIDTLAEFRWKFSELNRTLMSCPGLRVLVLVSLNLSADVQNTTRASNALLLPMVHLRRLEVLDLRGMPFHHTISILSWIDTGSSALSLGLTVPFDESMNEIFKLQPFIRRSHVARFCLEADYVRAGASEIFSSFLKESLPSIEELALQSCNYGSDVSELPSLRAEHFPRLHTLHLSRCVLDPAALQLALALSSIEKVQVLDIVLGALRENQQKLKEIKITPHVSFVLCMRWGEGQPLYEWPVSACYSLT